MCAIAGKVYLTNTGHISPYHLKTMANLLSHRGPDDHGIYISPNRKVGLANCRLAIVDLSSAGHQPMSYKNRYWITFNGEIYNYQSERAKLIQLGYAFSSHSDTEVILALYDKYREHCVDHLRGMWAFAIWDNHDQTLFLCRDRLGKKPLKYFHKNGVFVFASELKAFLSQPEVTADPDWLAIHHYLTFGYCPAPLTGFKHISKLEPAHWLKLHLPSGKLTKKCYWQLDFSHQENLSKSQWQGLILSELETSTRLRMTADVPVGAFLSGGVDSSAVVAMLAKNSSKPIKTFTIGFAEDGYDETHYAAIISRLFHTDHTVLEAKPQSIEILPELVAAYEEPFADSSSVITYMVSKLARKHVKVILNGDGGDENFAGYNHHLKLARDLWLSRHPWVYTTLNSIGYVFPRINRFAQKRTTDVREKYLDYKSFFSRQEKLHLYQPTHLPLVRDHTSLAHWFALCRKANTASVANQLLFADFSSYFPDDLLAKVDIASMQVGLEARSPLADHVFCELTAKIPFHLKVRHGQTKYILKKSLEGLIPKEILYRPKMGFSVPLSHWFTGHLKPYTLDQLLKDGSILKQLFKSEEIVRMLSTHSLSHDFGPKLWSLLTLQLWWDHYFRT